MSDIDQDYLACLRWEDEGGALQIELETPPAIRSIVDCCSKARNNRETLVTLEGDSELFEKIEQVSGDCVSVRKGV